MRKISERATRQLAKAARAVLYSVVAMAATAVSASAQANQFASSECSKVMEDIFSIDEASFATDIKAVSADTRDAKARNAFLREYMALMRYTAANNKANYNAFFEASDAAFSAASGSRYEDNLLSWLHIHKCMVYIYDGSLVSGGIQFWKAYRSFKSAEDDYAGYDGQLPLRGIFNVIFSQIPEKWKSLAGFLGFGEGNTTLGFKQIEQYRQKVKNIRGLNDEAVIFSFANMFFSFEQALPEEILDAIRSNEAPVVRYAYILSCGRSQNGEEATKSLNSTSETMMRRFPLLYHQCGKYALRRLEPDEAIRWGNKFANTYNGVSNKCGVYLDMAYAYMLKGDRQNAEAMVRKCRSIKSDFDIDRRAYEEAAIALGTPTEMLRARLQFEYGNFAESAKTLKAYTPRSADMAEYHFRMARAADKMNDHATALSYYDKTIAESANSTRYFGPYAAVHAAEICIKQHQTDKAKSYLAKARKLNNGEYKKELDQRIELGERKIVNS